MNSMKRQHDRILREELLRSVGAQYATRDQWSNNCRTNEGMEPKQKEYPAVDVTGTPAMQETWVRSLGGGDRRKWQPTPVFLPGESQGRGSLVGCRLWGHTELDTTEAT